MQRGAGDPALPRTGEEPRPRPRLRSLAEYAAVAAGALLMLLGWYAISGKASVAEQLPYLASASIPGLALVVGGAVLIAGDRVRVSQDRASDYVGSLFRLLTVAVESPPASSPSHAGTTSADTDGAADAARLVTVPGGGRYHRPACPLVAGKAAVVDVDGDAVASGNLEPCPICDPTPPATATSSSPPATATSPTPPAS